jgi:hypothetical protein
MKQKQHFHNGESTVTRLPAQTTNSNRTASSAAKPSQNEEVAMKAYLIYVSEGCPQGRDAQHWLEAEAQTLATAEPKKNAS